MATDKKRLKRGVYVLDGVNFIQQKYLMGSKCHKLLVWGRGFKNGLF